MVSGSVMAAVKVNLVSVGITRLNLTFIGLSMIWD